jgi:hypothetical protein
MGHPDICCENVLRGQRVTVTGIGKSGIIAHKIAAILRSAGRKPRLQQKGRRLREPSSQQCHGPVKKRNF